MPSKRPGADPVAALRSLLSQKKAVAVPGVFDAAVALLAREAGFECLYLSGAALSGSMALPDVGVTTLPEVVGSAARITAAVPSLPLIVDVDTGFGEAVNVARTVRELERAGAAGMQIEDQVLPKRCGHLDGKEVVEPEAMAEKIIAAKSASKKGIVVVARTDALEPEGFDGAVSRARLYKRAGADAIFPEALGSRDEFAEFAKKVGAPLVANMTEFGKTPYISVSEFSELEGYRLVLFPVTTFRVALHAVRAALRELARSGTQRPLLDSMMAREQFYRLIGYDSLRRSDRETSRRASKLHNH